MLQQQLLKQSNWLNRFIVKHYRRSEEAFKILPSTLQTKIILKNIYLTMSIKNLRI
jgi:hypothetical protein